MGISDLLDTPFYTGASTSSLVPGGYHVSLGGRNYLVDTRERFFHASIPLLRAQADQARTPGENSINPDDLWRRSQDDWSHGAGQSYLDRPESDPARFRTSKGIDPWTRWQASMLYETTLKRASVNTNLRAIPVGTYAYLSDGNEVYHSTDLATFTAATIQAGEAAASVQSITSDGYNVWAALGTNGIHTSTRGATTSTHYGNNPAGRTYSLIAYVKGRLMAAAGVGIYNITATGAAPTSLFDHGNTDWTWTGFGEGPNAIYAIGYAGDKSLIYRIAITAEGTSLTAPTVAGELPDGEIAHCIASYVGVVILGTSKGLRIALPEGAGLTIGPVVPTASAIKAVEPQERFIWYALTNYDALSTGLGRADPTVFTAALTPAYATDLMATVQGEVQSVMTFNNKRAFTVSGSGLWYESTNRVASGTLETGKITYDLPDPKMAVFMDLRHLSLAGSISTDIAVDGGAYNNIGISNTAATTGPTSPFSAGNRKGEHFELRHTWTRSSGDNTLGPSLTRNTLRSYPLPARSKKYKVPLLLRERIEDRGQEIHMNPSAEISAIEEMETAGNPVTFQDGRVNTLVFVEEVEFFRESLTSDSKYWNGTAVVTLKTVA